jgi:hypothetical protein
MRCSPSRSPALHPKPTDACLPAYLPACTGPHANCKLEPLLLQLTKLLTGLTAAQLQPSAALQAVHSTLAAAFFPPEAQPSQQQQLQQQELPPSTPEQLLAHVFIGRYMGHRCVDSSGSRQVAVNALHFLQAVFDQPQVASPAGLRRFLPAVLRPLLYVLRHQQQDVAPEAMAVEMVAVQLLWGVMRNEPQLVRGRRAEAPLLHPAPDAPGAPGAPGAPVLSCELRCLQALLRVQACWHAWCLTPGNRTRPHHQLLSK